MTNMTPIDFVDRINQLLRNYNITEEQEYLYEILIPKLKRSDLGLTGDFLTDLYNKYDLSGRTVGFEFLRKLEINSNYVFFGLSDPFYIGLDKNTKEIIMFDSEFGKVHLKLAKDLDQFINVIILIFDYGLDGWISEKQYSKDDRKSLFLKIKEFVDQEYLTYYEQSYGN